MTEQEIYIEVITRPDPADRRRFLDQACAGNEGLRNRVEKLIDQSDQLGSFLENSPPVVGQAALPALCGAGVSPAITLDQPCEAPGTRIGPYKLLEQIGEGGFGVVFMAEQTEPVRRKVALKVLKPGMDTRQVIARFEAERQALAMMDHPNIAKIFDAGTTGQSTKSEARSTKRIQNSKQKIQNEENDPVSEFGPSSLEFVSDFEFRASNLTAGRPYFVMELVRGVPITDYCDQNRLTPRERLQLFITVCHGVQHAHHKGLIHRDLKPSNVLVSRHDTTPMVKIIDFGVAKALTQARSASEGSVHLTDKTLFTGFAQMIGTPLYMSPEQAGMSDLDVDTRSDIYSLGVLLYELLTGTTPFDKKQLSKVSFDELRRIIREQEPETVSMRLAKTRRVGQARAASDGPPAHANGPASTPHSAFRTPHLHELDWIVMKALEKDRSRRYESASALAADIQRYLSDEPVLACPPTTMYRFQKFARKHKPALATAAVVAASLILGTTVSAWQAARATTAEAQANANEQKAVANEQKAVANEQKAVANAAVAEQKGQEAVKQRDEVKAIAEKLAAKEQQLQRTLYAAHMNLARHAWDEAAITRMQNLLEQHKPKAGGPDVRGFEWRFLHRLAHQQLLTLRGHTNQVNSAAYSHDGKHLASGSRDGTVRIWSAETGKELRRLEGHLPVNFNGVNWVAFGAAGMRLASATDTEIKTWDVRNGEELATIKANRGFECVAFSSDGNFIVTGGLRDVGNKSRSDVAIWDAQTGKSLRHWDCPGIDAISTVCISPDGKRLACDGVESIALFDMQTGMEVVSKRADVWYIAFSPDGQLIAAGNEDAVELWDAATFQVRKSFAGGYELDFSADGQRLAISSSGTLTIREVETGKDLLSLKGIETGAGFSPDGNRIASVCSDNTVKVWDARTSRESLTLEGAGGDAVTFSPDGQSVASGSLDGSVKIWNSQTGQLRKELQGFTVPVRVVTYSSDGKRLMTAGYGDRSGVSTADKTHVKMWNIQTNQEMFGFEILPDLIHPVATRVLLSPDGRHIVSPGRRDVRIWDAETGQELPRLKRWGISSPDGKYMAACTREAGRGGQVQVWDAQTGENVFAANHGSGWLILAFSPDSRRLAAASNGNDPDPAEKWTVKLWDIKNGQLNFSLPSRGVGFRPPVAFSPDGERIVSAGGKGVVVWDAQTGEELLTLKGADNNPAASIAFSPDGNRLAIGSYNQTVRIWDASPLSEKP